MQIQANPSSVAILNELAHSTRQSHWLLRDLTVIPKSFYHTCLHNFMLKYFPLMRFCMKIDLKESQKKLKLIEKNEVNAENTKMVFLFNAAIRQFNTIAPSFALKEIVPHILQQLIDEGIRPPVSVFAEDLLKNIPPCTNEDLKTFPKSTNYFNSNLYFEWIKDFEKWGGKVVFLSTIPLDQRYPALLGIKDQEIIPVCHLGLIRSPTLALIARLVKRKIGFAEGCENVRRANGINSEYDPYAERQFSGTQFREDYLGHTFQEAFGVPRPFRFGKEIFEKLYSEPRVFDFFYRKTYSISNWKQEFNDRYYSTPKTTPKIFLTFGDAGLSIIHRLMQVNLPKNFEREYVPTSNFFENVTVVLIPDGDNISNFSISGEMFRIITKMIKSEAGTSCLEERKFSTLTAEDRRLVLYTIKGYLPQTPEFKDKMRFYYEVLQKFSQKSKARMKFLLNDFFIQESFRAAFWRWSGMFQALDNF